MEIRYENFLRKKFKPLKLSHVVPKMYEKIEYIFSRNSALFLFKLLSILITDYCYIHVNDIHINSSS